MPSSPSRPLDARNSRANFSQNWQAKLCRGRTGTCLVLRVNGGEFAGPQPLGGRVDDDTVSRFATCCKGTFGSVGVRPPAPGRSPPRTSWCADPHRRRPVRRLGRTGRRRRRTSRHRCSSALSVTAATAGVLQRRIPLAPGALGFRLRHRAAPDIPRHRPDDFHLAHAAARPWPLRRRTCRRHRHHRNATARLGRGPSGWASLNYRAGRWNDVVKLLTPWSTTTRWTMRTGTPPASPWAPRWPGSACSPRAVPPRQARGGRCPWRPLTAHSPGAGAARHGEDLDAADTCGLYAAHPENRYVRRALLDPSYGIVDHRGAVEGPHRSLGSRSRNPPRTTSSIWRHATPSRTAGRGQGRSSPRSSSASTVRTRCPAERLSVAMALLRQQRAWRRKRTHHLVFAGPSRHR